MIVCPSEEPALNQALQYVTPLGKSLVTRKEDHMSRYVVQIRVVLLVEELSPLYSPDSVQKREEPAERHPESRLEQDYNEIIELGQGGYGIVYRAKHKWDHRFYAIKVIKLPSE